MEKAKFAMKAGSNGSARLTAEAFFASSKTKRNNPETNTGLIVLAEVTQGEIQTGNLIRLIFGGKQLVDNIVSIEENNQPLESASTGQKIGICLKNHSAKNVAAMLS